MTGTGGITPAWMFVLGGVLATVAVAREVQRKQTGVRFWGALFVAIGSGVGLLWSRQ